MNNNLTWGDRMHRFLTMFGTAEGRGAPAKEMIKKSNTNRIIESPRQAQLSIAIKMGYRSIISLSKDKNKESIWKWIDNLPEEVHEYQMTMQGQSRKDYKEVVGLQAKAAAGKPNTLSIEANTGGNEQ
jgi:hypothetical protein